MQKLELTLAIIKPPAVSNPVVRTFIRNILKNKFVIVKTKGLTMDNNTACKFYKEHAGKLFFNRLTTFMCSGRIDLHVLAHVDAIALWRRLLGPTSVFKGQFQDPYCLRATFGLSDTRNVAHGSDSQQSAEREIKFFFPDFSFYHWCLDDEEWFRRGPITFNDHSFQHVKKLT